MANLLGQNIGTNYKGILNLNTLNGNLSGTLQAVTDGDGNASPLTLSTGEIGITRTIALSAGATNVRLINETYTINNSGAQSGTATGIFLNATETTLNGMGHNLFDFQINGFSRMRWERVNANQGQLLLTNVNGGVQAAFNAGDNSGNFGYIGSTTNHSFSIITNNSYRLIIPTAFTGIQLGGTTNLFPALKRNGAAIDFRLANDSAYCDVNTGVLSIQNTVAAAVAVASTHKVTVVIGGVTYYLLASNI